MIREATVLWLGALVAGPLKLLGRAILILVMIVIMRMCSPVGSITTTEFLRVL